MENVYREQSLEFILNGVSKEFDHHIDSVYNLMNFDSAVLDICIQSLEILERKLHKSYDERISNLNYLPTNTISALVNIKVNESLKNQYGSMYNQCIVLLNSYFSTVVKEIFRKSINYLTINNQDVLISVNDDLKFSVVELSQFDFDLKGHLGDIIINKSNFSFQDMKSITNLFKRFLTIDIHRNENINTIILSQAARHCIVHSSAIIDQKYIKQVRNITDKEILNALSLKSRIQFTKPEIMIVADRMKKYLQDLITKLLIRVGNID